MRTIVAESWLVVSGVLGLIGFASGSMTILLVGAMIFGAGGIARLWAAVALDRVTYTRHLSERRLYLGEEVSVTLGVKNAKIVPVPWIEVRETVPRGMPASVKTSMGGGPGTQYFERSTSLRSNDEIEWPFTMKAVRRGYFRVGPTLLRSGDLFGFFERDMETGRPTDGIIVYPHLYTLPELGLPSARPFGELRGTNRIFEDPSRVVGVRDYQPSDPLRRIDWYATARSQRMQSKVYEPSRSQALVVAVSIPTEEEVWRSPEPVLLERAVSIGASICRWGIEQKYAVGLVANGSFPEAPRTIHVGAGNNPAQLNVLLEALAVVTPFTTVEMSRALEDPGNPLPPGATLVLVTALITERTQGTLLRLQARGHRVHVLKTSDRLWTRDLGSIQVTEMAATMEVLEAAALAAGIAPPVRVGDV